VIIPDSGCVGFNTAYQTTLKDTPFKIVYGRDPPTICSYEPGETRVAAVAKSMGERDELLANVRYHLEQARWCTRSTTTISTKRPNTPWVTGSGSASINAQRPPTKLRRRES